MYFKKFLMKLIRPFVERGRIYLDYSSKVEIPEDSLIALVSPYAEISGYKEKAFAYLSITEIPVTSPFFCEIPDSMLLKYREEWGSWLIDIKEPLWIDILKREVLYIREKGFRHLFVDTADGVETICNLLKESTFSYRLAIRHILESIRETMPEKILLNRGFLVYQEISDLIDGILVESLFFGKKDGNWHQRSREELSWLYGQVEMVQRDGKEIYAIDYAPEAKRAWYLFRWRAQTRGIIWDVIL